MDTIKQPQEPGQRPDHSSFSSTISSIHIVASGTVESYFDGQRAKPLGYSYIRVRLSPVEVSVSRSHDWYSVLAAPAAKRSVLTFQAISPTTMPSPRPNPATRSPSKVAYWQGLVQQRVLARSVAHLGRSSAPSWTNVAKVLGGSRRHQHLHIEALSDARGSDPRPGPGPASGLSPKRRRVVALEAYPLHRYRLESQSECG